MKLEEAGGGRAGGGGMGGGRLESITAVQGPCIFFCIFLFLYLVIPLRRFLWGH